MRPLTWPARLPRQHVTIAVTESPTVNALRRCAQGRSLRRRRRVHHTAEGGSTLVACRVGAQPALLRPRQKHARRCCQASKGGSATTAGHRVIRDGEACRACTPGVCAARRVSRSGLPANAARVAGSGEGARAVRDQQHPLRRCLLRRQLRVVPLKPAAAAHALQLSRWRDASGSGTAGAARERDASTQRPRKTLCRSAPRTPARTGAASRKPESTSTE
jgi:hypothetical protein